MESFFRENVKRRITSRRVKKMFCDQCGKELKEGTKFCTGCGAPIKAVAPKEPVKKIFCDQCGRELKKGVNFCPGCGAKVNIVEAEPAVPPVEEPKPAAPEVPAEPEIEIEVPEITADEPEEIAPTVEEPKPAVPPVEEPKPAAPEVPAEPVAPVAPVAPPVTQPTAKKSNGGVIAAVIIIVVVVVIAVFLFLGRDKIQELMGIDTVKVVTNETNSDSDDADSDMEDNESQDASALDQSANAQSANVPSIVPEQPEVDSEEEDSEYILENSDSIYLTKEDLEGLDAEQCRLARNEIYARHGRMFDDEELQAYFDSLSWYEGTIPAADFNEGMLNDYEIANRDLIVEYEKDMGYR
jgi:Sec-independent protein translocase protein TatA